MKAVLEFNLPEEQEEFDYATKGALYSIVLFELDQYLRTKTKYESDSLTEGQYEVYESIRNKLRELAEERGVNIL